MVEISEAPNMKRIQDQIAEKIGLKLDGMHSVEQRRTILYNRLENNTILIILDNVWAKLDLSEVGIPLEPKCKVLMVSRKKSLCKETAPVENCNMFELGRLRNDEARNLFWSKVSFKENITISEEYLNVADKLLSKCGGLPLVVITLARVLSGNTLLYWESFAAELERRPPSIGSSSSQQQLVSGDWSDDDHEYLSILEISYLLLSTQQRVMFLLCCLFPSGARAQQLMRYAIGLGLIQRVNNLFEAEELANTWLHRLISSTLAEAYDDVHDDNLLSQGRCVKIPDLIRRYGISILAKDKHMVMVEHFHRWLWEETCQKYYAISLVSGADHSRLDGLNSDKLQILILDRSQPCDGFSDGFFEGMTNLKVLVLKGMKFRPGLPKAIRKLKRSLRTLLLEDCELGDITVIGELTNLVVLSLRESRMEEIPEAIGNLCNLRLLDLTTCRIKKGGIAANVLSKLSLLEGLYALNAGREPWRYNNNSNNNNNKDDSKKGEYSYYAHFAELNYLSFLKLLELHVAFNDWPIHDDQLQFINNLDHFHISFGSRWEFPSRGYSRALCFENSDSWSSIVKYNGVRVVLEKTQFILLDKMWELQYIDDDIQQQEEDETKMQLSNIQFPLLQHLEIFECDKMQSSLSSTPFKAPNLTHLELSCCSSMKYIFMEHDDADHQLNNAHGDPHFPVVPFPCLKVMELENLPKLKSVTGLIKRGSDTTNDDDDEQPGHHILFNHKIIFPSLEDLTLDQCYKIVQLWEVNCKEMSYYSSFSNLHSLKIDCCKKLESLGSLSIATALVHLKTLSIMRCPRLREVIISSKEEEEIKATIFADRIFPSLESVELEECPELKMFISIPGEDVKDQAVKLSFLQHLEIDKCPEMRSFGPILKAPNLKQITYDMKNYPVDESTDINSFLQNSRQPKCEDESEKTKETK